MKKKIGLIIALVVVALIFIAVFYVVSEFTGNPITKLFIKYRAEKYLKENYSELSFKKEKPIYNIKFNGYTVRCYVENSLDQHFSIMFNKSGKLIEDDYEDIINGTNTQNRLTDDFNQYVEDIIRKALPYNYDILGCDAIVNKKNAFTLNQEFNKDDFINLSKDEIDINITDYIETERADMSWDIVMKKLSELDKVLQDNGILADNISLLLTKKDEKDFTSFGAHDITREMIQSDNLEKLIKQKYYVDGVIPHLMFTDKRLDTAEETNMMYEFEPLLIKWDNIDFNTFLDFKSYLSYIDNNNWERIEQIKELKSTSKYDENSTELNESRLEFIDYYELNTFFEIQMDYGDVPDKCIITDFILNADGTLKYGDETAMSSEIKFVDGKATYTVQKHLAALLSSNTHDYEKGNTIRGIRLSCEYGENKADYLYVFRTDALEEGEKLGE